MNLRIPLLVVVALVSALGGVPAVAQPGVSPAAQPAAGGPGRPAAAPPADSKREQIKRKLLALRAFRLTEELRLDETSAARVFPVLSKYDPQLEQLTTERLLLLRQLRGTLTAAAADDVINRAVANRRALLDLEERRLADLRKVLTPQQTARLLVVLPEIETQLKRQIRQIVRKQSRAEPADDLVDPFVGRKKKRQRQIESADPLDELE